MRALHKAILDLSTEISTELPTNPKLEIVKPIEHSSVSPYLQQRLRSMDEVREERERRQRELAEAAAKRAANDTTAAVATAATERLEKTG